MTFFHAYCTSFHILILFYLPLSCLILAISMCECLRKHSRINFIFSIAILNGHCLGRSFACQNLTIIIFILQPLRLDVKRGLTARSDRVKCVDQHPSEPWMLAALYNGNVHVWNLENQQLVKSFEVSTMRIVSYCPQYKYGIKF